MQSCQTIKATINQLLFFGYILNVIVVFSLLFYVISPVWLNPSRVKWAQKNPKQKQKQNRTSTSYFYLAKEAEAVRMQRSVALWQESTFV